MGTKTAEEIKRPPLVERSGQAIKAGGMELLRLEECFDVQQQKFVVIGLVWVAA
ncbi:hypothetical protein MCEMSEM23_02156 [Rhabdaerophilaceae bacterium]